MFSTQAVSRLQIATKVLLSLPLYVAFLMLTIYLFGGFLLLPYGIMEAWEITNGFLRVGMFIIVNAVVAIFAVIIMFLTDKIENWPGPDMFNIAGAELLIGIILILSFFPNLVFGV